MSHKTETITTLCLTALMRHEIYPTISNECLNDMNVDEIIDFFIAEAVHNSPALKAAEAKLAELERGEYICQKCGLRKDAEFTPGDF